MTIKRLKASDFTKYRLLMSIIKVKLPTFTKDINHTNMMKHPLLKLKGSKTSQAWVGTKAIKHSDQPSCLEVS